MLNITLICVGKIKEKFYCGAVDEYKKRLSRFCKLNIIQVKGEPNEDGQQKIVLNKEAEKIAAKIPKGAYIISLCVEGKQLSSEQLSEKIESLSVTGESHIVFIIGGSLGLDNSIKSISDLKLSFSKMTFPHQLMRVILLEQIYRAFTISAGITYHK